MVCNRMLSAVEYGVQALQPHTQHTTYVVPDKTMPARTQLCACRIQY